MNNNHRVIYQPSMDEESMFSIECMESEDDILTRNSGVSFMSYDEVETFGPPLERKMSIMTIDPNFKQWSHKRSPREVAASPRAIALDKKITSLLTTPPHVAKKSSGGDSTFSDEPVLKTSSDREENKLIDQLRLLAAKNPTIGDIILSADEQARQARKLRVLQSKDCTLDSPEDNNENSNTLQETKNIVNKQVERKFSPKMWGKKLKAIQPKRLLGF